MQKLNMEGGISPDFDAHHQGNLYDSHYISNYILTYCIDKKCHHCPPDKPKMEEGFVVYTPTIEQWSLTLLDAHCADKQICIGWFSHYFQVWCVYTDAHLKYSIRYLTGQCIIVAKHPDPLFYCVYMIAIDHKGEITIQGAGNDKLDSTLLTTAASGEYTDFEGAIKSSPTKNSKGQGIIKFELI